MSEENNESVETGKAEDRPAKSVKEKRIDALVGVKMGIDADLAEAIKAERPSAYELKRAARGLQDSLYWLRRV